MEPIAASGNLEQTHVAHLLVRLHQQNATGSLKLEHAPLQKAVYLKEGQILFAASNDPKDQLASILVEEGKLGPDQMAIAQARVSAGNPLAKILTDLGYVSQRELADAARLKVEKILADLYSWKEGSFQFAEGSLPKGAIDLELSTVRLLFNSMRRMQDRDWVLQQVGSLDTVLAATPSLSAFVSAADPDPKAEEVLRAVDSAKTIKQIAATSTLGEFEVGKVLAAALVLGALEKGQRLAPTEVLRVPPTRSEPNLATLFDMSSEPTPSEPTERAAVGRPSPRESGPSRLSDFIIDEPSGAPRGPQSRLGPKSVAHRRRGGSSRGAFLTLLLVLVLGGGALYYVYVYLPKTRRPPRATQATTTTAPVVTTTPVTSTIDAAPIPSSVAPTTALTTAPPAPTSVPSARPGGSPPTPTRPTTTITAPRATGARQALENGDYAGAAAQFLAELRASAPGKYSIAVGLNCDIENVAKAVRSAAGSGELFILPARYNNRSCYRLCWGRFDSVDAAELAMSNLPEYFRKQRPVPIATERLLR